MNDANPEWLFMVYMVATEDNRLDPIAVQDLIEMERAVKRNPRVQVLVQIHRQWPPKPERYLITAAGTTPHECAPEADDKLLGSATEPVHADEDEESKNSMGREGVLKGFLKHALNLKGVRPATTHYALVLWGHSAGLGFGRDHGNRLTLNELKHALLYFKEERERLSRPLRGDGTLELLGGNTCVLSYIEAIYELRQVAEYLVASELFVPFAGWPYEAIFATLPGRPPTTTAASRDRYLTDVGTHIVDTYANFFQTIDRDERVAMTLARVGAAKDLAEPLAELAGTLRALLAPKDSFSLRFLHLLRDVFLANPVGTTRPVLDLVRLLTDIRELARSLRHHPLPFGSIRETTDLKEVRTTLRKSHPALFGPDEDGHEPSSLENLCEALETRTRQLTAHHRAHRSFTHLHGIGIFAPFVMDDGRLTRFKEIRFKPKPARQANSKNRAKSGLPTDLEAISEGFAEYARLEVFRPSRAPQEAAGDAGWPRLVFDALCPVFREEFVDASGAVQMVERSALNQMIYGVDATFRQLSFAIAGARAVVTDTFAGDRLSDDERVGILTSLAPPTLRLTSLETAIARLERGQADHRKRKTRPVTSGAHTAGPIAALALATLERRLTEAERTTLRVVTDAQLGIGPPMRAGVRTDDNGKPPGDNTGKPPGDILGKSPGDVLSNKPPGEALNAKSPGDSLLVKSPADALGSMLDSSLNEVSLGSQLVFMASDPSLGSIAVIDLLGHIARAFGNLERDVAEVERALAEGIVNTPKTGHFPLPRYNEAMCQRLDELFDRLEESHQAALLTLRWVFRHPTFGLGPGPTGFGRRDREMLASAAGLNARQLRLLS